MRRPKFLIYKRAASSHSKFKLYPLFPHCWPPKMAKFVQNWKKHIIGRHTCFLTSILYNSSFLVMFKSKHFFHIFFKHMLRNLKFASFNALPFSIFFLTVRISQNCISKISLPSLLHFCRTSGKKRPNFIVPSLIFPLKHTATKTLLAFQSPALLQKYAKVA